MDKLTPEQIAKIRHIEQDTKYAKDSRTGRMIHISQVERGEKCGCVCAGCGRNMVANKGDVKQHYFSHKPEPGVSTDKTACYISTMHCLAEEIIKNKKRIMLPSYFDVIPAKIITFETVEIEERKDRCDMQPDIVGTTSDGQRYLIEIKYTHAVDGEKKKKILGDKLTCLEIDISKQDMEGLKEFLLSSAEDRHWINNEYAFNLLKEQHNANLVPKVECIENCVSFYCVFDSKRYSPVEITHHNVTYILCKNTKGCVKSSKAISKEHNLQTRSSYNSDFRKKHNTTQKNHYTDNPRCSDRGNTSRYPLMPNHLNPTIDDYYNNIKNGSIFYKDGNKIGHIIDVERGKNSVALVVGTKVGASYSFDICVIETCIGSPFIHRWYGPYEKDYLASLALKKIIK